MVPTCSELVVGLLIPAPEDRHSLVKYYKLLNEDLLG